MAVTPQTKAASWPWYKSPVFWMLVILEAIGLFVGVSGLAEVSRRRFLLVRAAAWISTGWAGFAFLTMVIQMIFSCMRVPKDPSSGRTQQVYAGKHYDVYNNAVIMTFILTATWCGLMWSFDQHYTLAEITAFNDWGAAPAADIAAHWWIMWTFGFVFFVIQTVFFAQVCMEERAPTYHEDRLAEGEGRPLTSGSRGGRY